MENINQKIIYLRSNNTIKFTDNAAFNSKTSYFNKQKI